MTTGDRIGPAPEIREREQGSICFFVPPWPELATRLREAGRRKAFLPSGRPGARRALNTLGVETLMPSHDVRGRIDAIVAAENSGTATAGDLSRELDDILVVAKAGGADCVVVEHPRLFTLLDGRVPALPVYDARQTPEEDVFNLDDLVIEDTLLAEMNALVADVDPAVVDALMADIEAGGEFSPSYVKDWLAQRAAKQTTAT